MTRHVDTSVKRESTAREHENICLQCPSNTLIKQDKHEMKIKIYTVGGTIDKVYFDRKSTYEVGEPKIGEILKEANVNFEFEISSILHKDSLDMTDEDRRLIFDKIASDEHRHILLTHGTDTIIQTAKKLKPIPGKVIVLTGAMEPARFKYSDAAFNIGCAVAALQVLTPGVYIAINGRIFDPDRVKKNLEQNWFEEL
jgi:L-asparaginase